MTIISGTNGADSLTGTSGSDIISGGNGNDLLSGGAGNDVLSGGNGSDTLLGGTGTDLLTGGNGNDVLSGGDGADILSGDNGDDSLDGGGGSDLVTGGSGNDVLTFAASENVGTANIYDGGSGRDRLRLVVSQSLYNSPAFQAELAEFQAKLAQGSASHLFQTLDLLVTSIEEVEVIVVGSNHAPTAANDSINTSEDAAISIAAATFTANDSDPDGDAITLVSVGNPQHGTVQLVAGNVVFTPEADFSGPASFTYTIQDSQGATSTATVVVNVAPVADAPDLDVVAAEGTAGESIPLNITLALTDPSETLGTVTIEGVPADSYTLSHGTQIGDGIWEVAVGDLPSLALVPVAGATLTSGNFDLHVVATSIDGADTATAEGTLSVTVAPAPGQTSGRVIDGYIAGATVFADTDGDGVLDSGEVWTTTNADGSFTLTGAPAGANLVMFGGTDVSTGLAFDGTLSAPAGSTVVTPLTTLVTELVASGSTVEDAQNAVAAAFGFDASIDLQTYDPVPAAVGGDATATAVLSAAIQVQSAVAQISAVTGESADALGAIAVAITAAGGGSVDLSEQATVEAIATDAGVDAAALAAVAKVVAAAAASIQGAGDVTELAQAAQVAQGEAADALANTDFNNTSEVAALTQTYVDNLGAEVAAAEVGDVDGPLVGTLGNDTLTGTAGADAIDGLDGNDKLVGGAGDDLLYGGAGRDRAVYVDATASITVDMAAGIVTGDASVGTDTLRSIEQVGGSNFADTYVATGFSQSSPNTSSVGNGVNTFEGMAGDDVITGNGNTQLSYLNATAAVTVDLAAGTATGDASVGTDTFTGVNRVRGSQFDDTLLGSNAGGVEQFTGGAGNDFIDGRTGNDRAVYSSFVNDTVTAGVTINLAAGTVTGDASVGTDTLRSIEFVRGSNFADAYDATGFTTSSVNAGNSANNSGAAFNEIEGMGGNDTITGNGNTRIAFYNATAGVTVDIQAGTATGDTSVGSDTFTNVGSIAGSQFADTFSGSNNPSQTSEQFEGRGGNDTFDGRGGFDQAIYNNDTAVTSGISVDMAAGTVTGDAAVGTDTLVSIESVRGTNFADTYVATGFSGASTDTGLAATFNEFEGLGGNDMITGNGNTRISFVSSSGGVTVDLVAGTATGNSSVGSDTFTGVSRVRGSNSNDTILGGAGNNNLDGQGGNDLIEGRGGNDTLTGGTGNDTFVYASGDGADTIADFAAGAGSPDKIDLTGVSGVYSLADVLALASQSGPNVLINFGGGNSVTLQNVSLGTLHADDFIFATNQAPTDIALSGDTVAENSAAGTVVGALSALDPDAGDSASFTLIDDAGGRFAISGGDLVVAGALDFEAATSHDVTVRVTDSAGNTFDETFTINVSNVNEAPTDIALSNATVPENSALSTVVGTLSALDPDAGDTASFTLIDDAGGRFAISGGNLVVAGALDFETAASHDVTVRVTDSAGNMFDETFTINVSDVNEAPTAVSFDNAITAIDENVAVGGGIKVADITVSDDALGTETLTLSGADAASFAIVGNALYYVGSSPDFETQSSYSVMVNANDESLGVPGSVEASQAFTLTINDVAGLVLTGDANANTLIGSPEVDTLSGLGGADTLDGGAGNDSLDGGDGNNDVLIGGAGADALNGGNGNDFASYQTSSSALTADLATPANNTGDAAGDTYTSIERLIGSAFDDLLSGNNSGNFLEGGAGADNLNGRGGFDYASYSFAAAGVTASLANQGLNTGEAAGDVYTSIEALTGSAFNDTLIGDSSNNNLRGNAGADVLDGGGGRDTAEYTNATGAVTADLGNSANNTGDAAGDTYLSIEDLRGSNSGADTLRGDGNSNFLEGGNGTFADVLDGASGNDFASYQSATTGVTASLANPGTNTGDAQGDIYISIEGFEGSDLNDTLIGDANQNFLIGGLGADALNGGGGSDWAEYRNAGTAIVADLTNSLNNTGEASGDTYVSIENLRGSNFNDTLTGDGSNNFLRGGGGADVLNGNGGSDTADYFNPNATAGITVDLANSGNNTGDAAGDTYSSIENVRGTALNDTLRGDANTNLLDGQVGADVLDGGDGIDYAWYNTATAGVTASLVNTAVNTGDAAGDTYIAIEGLFGSAFNDLLTGDANQNFLRGGAGADTLEGGAGNDAFVFAATNEGLDHITDFSGHGGEGDVLEFRQLAFGSGLAEGGANTGVLDASHFVANGTGATTAAEVFWFNTANYTLYYDADGSGSGAAVAITVLDNSFVLDSSDLHLI